MKIESKHGEVIVLVTEIHQDNRGWFTETFKQSEFARLTGVTAPFVQDNHSRSRAGVIRGLHFQPGMGKLMRVTRGLAMLVAVDLKTGDSVHCFSEANGRMMWAPDTYARGFMALAPNTEVQYKCTAEYDPKTEGCIRYDSVGIEWPCPWLMRIVSEKDQHALPWSDWSVLPK